MKAISQKVKRKEIYWFILKIYQQLAEKDRNINK